jgi:uncharacterized membrane protein (UPF0182 family)
MHIRYPMYLFSVQAELYETYHMTDPVVFYNKEDMWAIPKEIYSGAETELIPHYVIIKIPDPSGTRTIEEENHRLDSVETSSL